MKRAKQSRIAVADMKWRGFSDGIAALAESCAQSQAPLAATAQAARELVTALGRLSWNIRLAEEQRKVDALARLYPVVLE